MKRFLLTFLFITFSFFSLVEVLPAADLSPNVSALTKKFSEKFCTSIRLGMNPDKAGESSAAQISRGLLFSPVMNEIMSSSKEDLVSFLSNNIIDGCGNDLLVTKEELDDYLIKLAKKIPSKSTNNFQIAPIRQKNF